jgi:catechol 2,3-dioxygenase-like lactoylglutathione lyase family enzyme
VAAFQAEAGLTVELFTYATHGKIVPALPARPGISHVTFAVDDLEPFRARLDAAEALMTDDTEPTAGGPAGLWVHSRTTGGLVVRLEGETRTTPSKETP